MSLNELAAAMAPNVSGSSTMGVKKSTVCTSAVFSSSRYTPASSLVSNPTSTFGSVCRGSRRNTESSVPGLSLAAQPAALAIVVNLTRSLMRASSRCTGIIEEAAAGRLARAAGQVAETPALVLSSPMPWDFWLIFLLLGFVIPWRGYARMRHLMAQPEVTSRERIKMYLATIFFQWLLTALVAWRAFARGLSPRDLGIVHGVSLSLFVVTLLGASVIGATHWANVRRMARSDHPNVQRLRALGSRLFPRTNLEMFLFVVLSVTAGIC